MSVYKTRLLAPSAAVIPFTSWYKMDNPIIPVTAANATAWTGLWYVCTIVINIKLYKSDRIKIKRFKRTHVKLPRTKTRFFVRDICASKGTSKNWLIVFAVAETKPVPKEHITNVWRSNGVGANAYPAIVVAMTRAMKKRKYILVSKLNISAYESVCKHIKCPNQIF